MVKRPPGDFRRPFRPSILSPALDFLSAGGLSIIAFVPLLLSGRTDLLLIGAGAQAWLATTINMPHFMASYRLVYRSREMILRHKWASIYIPALLFLYVVVAVYSAQFTPELVTILVTVSATYLAWHYTGQVWGMMASYAFLAGTRFEPTERFLIRTSLRILLAWHVVWFFYTHVRRSEIVRPAYLVVSAGTVVAFVMGAVGLALFRRRTGSLPPALSLVAWVAIFVWYAVIARDPNAIFWVQIAHAIQYLVFPIRVEINRTEEQGRGQRGEGRGQGRRQDEGLGERHSAAGVSGRLVFHMVAYGILLLLVSYLVGEAVPAAAMSVVGDIFGDEPSRVAPVLILMFVNIHHYFTDGVIWKISNPEVRRELFAHVPGQRAAIAGKGPSGSGRADKGDASRSKRRGGR